MESLTAAVANQNIDLAKPSGINHDLRFKRRNGINQFQFHQQLMNARMSNLQLSISDLAIADSDQMSDHQTLTTENDDSEHGSSSQSD